MLTEQLLPSSGWRLTQQQAALHSAGVPENLRVLAVCCLLRCSGEAIAYHLHPAQGPCLLAQPDSAVAQRGMFTTKNLLVTPHVDGQLYPAGTYVFQSSRDSGLRLWTQQVRRRRWWC